MGLDRLVAVGAVVVLVAGCTSSIDGQGATAPVRPASSAPRPAATDPPARTPFPRLHAAIAGERTAHVHVDAVSDGLEMALDGDVQMRGGRPTAWRFRLDVDTLHLEVVGVGERRYLRDLPPEPTDWHEARGLYGDTVAGQLGIGATDVMSNASALDFSELAPAADEVTRHAQDTVGGQPVDHWGFFVDTRKLPGSSPGVRSLLLKDVDSYVADLYVDDLGRPTLYEQKVRYGTGTFFASVKITRYGERLTIRAPR